MVRKMNKERFLQKLKEELNVESTQANIINNIIETNNIFGKKNKEKIINDFIEQLNIDDEKANEIYEKTLSLISTIIKNKIKHPFKSQD